MKVNPLWATVLLVFRPSRLKALSARYNAELNTPESIAERQNRDAEVPYHERSLDRIRRGLICSFFLVFGASVAAAALGRLLPRYWSPIPPRALELLQYIGIGIILWATLAKQGWSIQTFNRTTVPEQLDEVIYRWLYVLGSFLLVLSVSMQFGI